MVEEVWPAIALDDWKPTYDTLHRWLQIVGKIRLSLTPWVNHGWHTALYVTARGLTTSPIPWQGEAFQIDVDFIDHKVLVRASDGGVRALELRPRSVADFYGELFAALAELGIRPRIFARPNELPDDVPFAEDREHAAYDAGAAHRFFLALSAADRVLKRFRGRFVGKCSPVHFFWGGLDLTVTRFSGRSAPAHPGGVPHMPDRITREAYSHEEMSCGFWPGSGAITYAAFYAYAYPEPHDFAAASVSPPDAFYSKDVGEFILPYDAVRRAADPEKTLLDFCQSAYEAAANAGNWDRLALEAKFPPEGPR